MKKEKRDKLTFAGMLIAIGIVYGDIGTSPLYVVKTILQGNGGFVHSNVELIYGSISLIFWTIMILTTVKYVCIALNATNKGEGGIFALYTLVKNKAKWLLVPALIGGAALLADGMLTPAVTVTTSVEGLKDVSINNIPLIKNQTEVVFITVIILSILFLLQRFGTRSIGNMFGPIMMIWFTFIGVAGFINMLPNLGILKALNPYYALHILFSPDNRAGIFILGSIFLATTGAEALYSDVGHVGKHNIDGSWPYVFLCLILNYLGQGVWVIEHLHNAGNYAHVGDFNPFFEILPGNWRFVGIVLATIAAIIASQALITGSYTLVSEAVGLKLLPRLKINYPTLNHGQIYMPAVNNILWITCVGIVFYFGTSSKMEAAYGLAITVTMLMTTILLYHYLKDKMQNLFLPLLMVTFFGTLETMFFISSMVKFVHGGYVTAIIAGLILLVMYIWYYGKSLREKSEQHSAFVSLDDYKDQLIALSKDESHPLFATNVVYMTKVKKHHCIKREILYSILDKRPKRADAYWFVTVNVTDEPYTAKYDVDMLGTKNIIIVQLYLGFRRSQRVNLYLRAIVNDLMESGDIDKQPQKYTTTKGRNVGDFSFVIVQEELSPETELISAFDKTMIQMRVALQNVTSSPASWFGLEFADVVNEKVPLILGKRKVPNIRRMRHKSNN